ncbi:MAG: hypothetical protein KatS3mg081_2525 [Gemmatimonadales bacterium]|nr:Disulfide bond formation protein D [bacterium HR33]GIW53170.1 MAG: hypothetical protein KatS3mg081_2525 [Gemmatimonadales bacterium]
MMRIPITGRRGDLWLRLVSAWLAAVVPLALPEHAGAQAVTEWGIERGDSAAPVWVIEFADFGCPACAGFATESFPAVDREFIQTGKVHWRFVPFVLGPFRHSKWAAAAALCAAEQNAFWKMHDRLFEEQSRWSKARDPKAVLSGIALELRLDSLRFAGCLDSKAIAGKVSHFNRLARRLLVRATPTFFVNQQRVKGALPLETFRRVLMEAANP